MILFVSVNSVLLIMSNSTDNICSEWEFVFDKSSDEYPLGYYLHIPSSIKYCFGRGITDKVGKKNEELIYNSWWINNS